MTLLDDLFKGYASQGFLKDMDYILNRIHYYESHFSCECKYFGSFHISRLAGLPVRIDIEGYKTLLISKEDLLEWFFKALVCIPDSSNKPIEISKRYFQYDKPKSQGTAFDDIWGSFASDLKNYMDEIIGRFETILLFGYKSVLRRRDEDSKIILCSKIMPDGNRADAIFELEENYRGRTALSDRHRISLVKPDRILEFDGKSSVFDEEIERMESYESLEKSVMKFEKEYVLKKYGMDYFMNLPSGLRDAVMSRE